MDGLAESSSLSNAFSESSKPKREFDIYTWFGIFVVLVILSLLLVPLFQSSNSTSDANLEVSQQEERNIPITQQVTEKSGPKDIFLDQSLSGALNMNAYQIGRSQGADVLAGCSNVYSVRLGTNCIYSWYMRERGEDNLITLADIKQQLTPGFSLPNILRELFPAEVYFNAVIKQFIWLAGQDESHGVKFSQY